jgi:hypothetical protein
MDVQYSLCLNFIEKPPPHYLEPALHPGNPSCRLIFTDKDVLIEEGALLRTARLAGVRPTVTLRMQLRQTAARPYRP